MKFKIAEPIQDEATVEAQLIIDEDGNLNLMIDGMVAFTVSKEDMSARVSLENYDQKPGCFYHFLWRGND